jgi:hypothetical protein
MQPVNNFPNKPVVYTAAGIDPDPPVEYPCMVYNFDGATKIVHDEASEVAAKASGWTRTVVEAPPPPVVLSPFDQLRADFENLKFDVWVHQTVLTEAGLIQPSGYPVPGIPAIVVAKAVEEPKLPQIPLPKVTKK